MGWYKKQTVRFRTVRYREYGTPWIVNYYFHNRIVRNYCTFPAPLTFGTIRILPEILLPTNYNSVS